jgi:hypothetical protein
MREEKITKTHATTFEWKIFNKITSQPFWGGRDNNGGVFWAMGNPGYRKSTLMKLLVNLSLTEQHLKTKRL